jgi:hypothetical protein
MKKSIILNTLSLTIDNISFTIPTKDKPAKPVWNAYILPKYAKSRR